MFGLHLGSVRSMSRLLLLKIEKLFPLNNLSKDWDVTMKLGIYVAYKERKVGIALGVSGVSITVTRNRNKMVSAQ